ncbi:MAG: RNA-guided endonuclease InsQ/TnpB family protein [Solirubrobacterales bacterium]
MRRAFKFRLFTNTNQERELETMRETHRRLYNACLDERKTVYDAEGRTVNYADQAARFTKARKTNPYYARINFSSAQATMRKLDKAYQAFFRRVKEKKGKTGFPRFKGRDRFDSIEFPSHGDGIRRNGDKLRVQNVGVIKIKLHRVVEGTIKTVTLKRDADQWYVVFSCELPDVPILPTDRPPAGIDVGLEAFLTTSDGSREPNPRYLKHVLPELRRKARAVSRKKLRSKNRRKAVKRLRKIHTRVRNLRKEHHHQVALKLIRRHGLIAVESLNIQGMLKNDRLSRAIADAGWNGFLLTLRCKAESAGIAYVEVDARGTSQQCSGCGTEVRKDLNVRRHDCPHCGLSVHRDENAAKNILARGLQARIGPVGRNVGQQVKRAPRSRRLQATE